MLALWLADIHQRDRFVYPADEEIPEEAVLRSKVVVDSLEGVLAEAGDLIIPLEKGLGIESNLEEQCDGGN